MKEKMYHLMILILLCPYFINAQNTKIQALKIGEEVPDLTLTMVNYSKPEISLNELKGKVVILDFWSTWCTVCIKQLPRLAQLQEKFKDNLVIIAVGFDTPRENGSIANFLKAKKGSPQEVKLPVSIQKISDTILQSLFPFFGLPHEVWIDKDGTIAAITGHDEVTEANISKLINNEKLLLTEKKVDKNFKYDRPLFENNNGGDPSNFINRSLFASYNATWKSMGFIRSIDSVFTRLFISNVSVPQLYKLAYGYYDTLNHKQLYYDTKNKFFSNEVKNFQIKDWNDVYGVTANIRNEFREKNLFSYELILPRSYSLEEAYKRMISDLDHFFRIKSSTQLKTRKVLVLKKVSNGQNITTPGTLDYEHKFEDDTLKLKNFPLPLLISYLNKNLDFPLFENGVIDDFRITINISLRENDIESLKKKFLESGIYIDEIEKKITMLVLTDN